MDQKLPQKENLLERQSPPSSGERAHKLVASCYNAHFGLLIFMGKVNTLLSLIVVLRKPSVTLSILQFSWEIKLVMSTNLTRAHNYKYTANILGLMANCIFSFEKLHDIM